MSYLKGLRCRACGRTYPAEALSICEECFGPLEVDYDYERIKRAVTPAVVARRPQSLWRYRELLPLEGEPRVGLDSGFTPLFQADRLGRALGIKQLWIKDDSVSRPTLSFKDRVVAVSLSKAKEFGFDTVGCASTGNLANSVAANAARAGLPAYIFVPADLERAKIVGTQIFGARVIGVRGNYDAANRLCRQVADRYHWALVNVNLRPYYAEGSKTFGFEIVEQLGWRSPDAIVVPMAGGALLTNIYKGLTELARLGWLPDLKSRMYGAQAVGCNPISSTLKENRSRVLPVKPRTIAKSIAIGDPADGLFAVNTIRQSGGWAEDVTDEEVLQGINLLAESEGVFSETAGGVTVAVTKKLVEQGHIRPDDLTVISITGHGLKTSEVCRVDQLVCIDASLGQFEEILDDGPPLSALSQRLNGHMEMRE